MFKPTKDYFLNIQPESFTGLGSFFLVTAMLSLILGAVLLMHSSKIPMFFRKLARKARKMFFLYGGISLLLYFFRKEKVPYLSMRLWLWIWFFNFWTIFFIVLYKEFRKIPDRKEKWQKELKLKRYAS